MKALLGPYALLGYDATECLKNKGKLSFWKAFQTAEEDTLEDSGKLGYLEKIKTVDEQRIEQFIYQVYSPGTSISDIGQLGWWMFAK